MFISTTTLKKTLDLLELISVNTYFVIIFSSLWQIIGEGVPPLSAFPLFYIILDNFGKILFLYEQILYKLKDILMFSVIISFLPIIPCKILR